MDGTGLRFEVAQSSVAKYMVKRRGAAQPGMADLLAQPRAGHCRHGPVHFPTIGFDLLYAFVIVRLGRRELIWINVTANPTAEWVARQVTEAGMRLRTT
jgi:hypothetical protein